jgi:hypothetical protein
MLAKYQINYTYSFSIAYVLGAYVCGLVVLKILNTLKNPIARTALNHKAEVNVLVELS